MCMHIIKAVYALDFSDATTNPVAKFSSISSFTNIVIPLMMLAGGFASLAMLLLGAFRYITSSGNPEKLAKAQSVMLYAVMGIFLMVISFVLIKIIGFILNVDIMPL